MIPSTAPCQTSFLYGVVAQRPDDSGCHIAFHVVLQSYPHELTFEATTYSCIGRTRQRVEILLPGQAAWCFPIQPLLLLTVIRKESPDRILPLALACNQTSPSAMGHPS